ncbi:Coproporphyrinogen III oxidase, aerobic [Fimbriiglobus ruber]|uniref:coproporphyrinogen oxidase n=1 Tax=Fimbriiglobus ruber TaxID=1908690 RepID=A0A225DWX7_9BACT|nr:Coproporphyrinogen III oxidase, aerobic [Fimbriiglobus ruber]
MDESVSRTDVGNLVRTVLRRSLPSAGPVAPAAVVARPGRTVKEGGGVSSRRCDAIIWNWASHYTQSTTIRTFGGESYAAMPWSDIVVSPIMTCGGRNTTRRTRKKGECRAGIRPEIKCYDWTRNSFKMVTHCICDRHFFAPAERKSDVSASVLLRDGRNLGWPEADARPGSAPEFSVSQAESCFSGRENMPPVSGLPRAPPAFADRSVPLMQSAAGRLLGVTAFGLIPTRRFAPFCPETLSMTMHDRAVEYFRGLQDRICAGVEGIDGAAKFRQDEWTRPGGGGGRSRVIEGGGVFEKAGVNFSEVHGDFTPSSPSRSRGTASGFRRPASRSSCTRAARSCRPSTRTSGCSRTAARRGSAAGAT